VSDRLLAIIDDPSVSLYAGNWLKEDYTDKIISVNGQTGAVVIADISGNSATVTTNANLTGEVTSTGNATTLTNSAVIAKVLTGFASGAGTVSATDSLLSAIQKIVGNLALKLTANSAITAATKTKITYDVNGLVTAGSDATTADIADSTNKRYVTDAQLAALAFPVYHVADVKASGTNGGTNTAGVNTRTFNTTVKNTLSGASLSGTTQHIIPAGNYKTLGRSPCMGGNNNQAYLWNVTDSVLLIAGSSEYSNATYIPSVNSVISGEFTISSQKTIELRHYIATANSAAYGLGGASSSGIGEVYATLRLEKIG
jgi:hypothetical protein